MSACDKVKTFVGKHSGKFATLLLFATLGFSLYAAGFHEDIEFLNKLMDEESGAFCKHTDELGWHIVTDGLDITDPTGDTPTSNWNEDIDAIVERFNDLHDDHKASLLKEHVGTRSKSTTYFASLIAKITPDISTKAVEILGYTASVVAFINEWYTNEQERKEIKEKMNKHCKARALERQNNMHRGKFEDFMKDVAGFEEFKETIQEQNKERKSCIFMIGVAVALMIFGTIAYNVNMGENCGKNNPIFLTIGIQGLTFITLYAATYFMTKTKVEDKEAEYKQKMTDISDEWRVLNPLHKEDSNVRGQLFEHSETATDTTNTHISRQRVTGDSRMATVREEKEEPESSIWEEFNSGEKVKLMYLDDKESTPENMEDVAFVLDPATGTGTPESSTLQTVHTPTLRRIFDIEDTAEEIESLEARRIEPEDKNVNVGRLGYTTTGTGRRLLTRPIDRIMNAIEK